MILSVVIPFYNNQFLVHPMIENLEVAMQQLITTEANACQQIEFILVDNGSSDYTRKNLKDLSRTKSYIKLLFLDEHRGYGHGVMQGLKLAQGQWFAWMLPEIGLDLHFLLKEFMRQALKESHTVMSVKLKRRSMYQRTLSFVTSLYVRLKYKVKLFPLYLAPRLISRDFYDLHLLPWAPENSALDAFVLFQAKLQKLDLVLLSPAHSVGQQKVIKIKEANCHNLLTQVRDVALAIKRLYTT